MRLMAWLERRSGGAQQGELEATEAVLDAVITRYLGNKLLIESVADARLIPSLFVLQPVPGYGWDMSHHLFRDRFMKA